MLKQTFSFIKFDFLIVNTFYYGLLKETNFLDNLYNFDSLEQKYKLIFFRKKHYRIIKGFQIKDLQFFVKKYEKKLEEAISEWKNIILLWENGFFTSIPLFFYKNSKCALIGTKLVDGRLCLEIIKENPQKNMVDVIQKIAHIIGSLHQKGFFHQDCYLNHFYLDEKTGKLYILDVSRLLNNPLFKSYYQIKDLSQMKYSIFYYFPNNWKELWEIFEKEYTKTYGKKLFSFQKLAIKLKYEKIKKHTDKLLRKRKV